MKNTIDRREALLSASAFALLATADARAQTGVAPQIGAQGSASRDTNWINFGNDLAATRYAGLDQINASNFNSLEVAWRFRTDNFGPRKDTYLNCTPIIVNGRLYATVGTDRMLVCLDPATGEMQWAYRHDEKGRQGARTGSGWGVSYWTDGTAERILYVTRSYQMISLDVKTGQPDPAFGNGNEVDLRQDFDHEVDPRASVLGLHAAPLIVKDVAVVGVASSGTGPGYLRGFDVRTGKRKWIFHTVPRKGEFGYDTWIKPGQAETATNTGVWAPMSSDPELGLVYAGVELPQADSLGVTRWGDALFTETLVALDIETGQRRWHYQTEHHGMWDRDICAAAVLFDLPYNGKVVKALALPTKQAFLFVLDRTTGKPIWPVVEKPAAKGDVPGEWYPPTQPWPTKPPPFDRQGISSDDAIDFTPQLKQRALEIFKHYRIGPLYTPPVVAQLDNPNGPWGTIVAPEGQGGSNWTGGSYDPETGIFYVYSKSNLQVYGPSVQANGKLANGLGINGVGRGTNDNMGANYLGGPIPAGTKDGLTDPIVPGMLSIGGLSLLKPPYGRITALDLKSGTKLWQIAHGETPDFIKNNPLLKGINIPRTGQSGILGVLTTRSLVICGDSGGFTDEQGRKAARLRAYDKATGKEVGAVFMEQPQTGSPMTFMLAGHQHIIVASSGRDGGEFICFRLPGFQGPAAANGGRGGRGGSGAQAPGPD